jgi:hypothetical protein
VDGRRKAQSENTSTKGGFPSLSRCGALCSKVTKIWLKDKAQKKNQ